MNQAPDGFRDIVIEAARPEDAPEIRRVQAATWMHTYPNQERGITVDGVRKRVEGEFGEKIFAKTEFWREHIESSCEEHAVFVARRNQKIIGYVAPSKIDDQNRLGSLYVLPEAQRSGAGALLLLKALDWWTAKVDVYLHVAVYNENAIAFYQKFGFQMTGKYFDDEDGKELGAIIPEFEMVRPGRQS